MFQWLRKLFRRGPNLKPLLAIVSQEGKVITVRPLRATGLRLLCSSETGDLLVGDSDAIDPEQYWGHWEKLGGKDLNLRWEEDDKPFDPLKNC